VACLPAPFPAATGDAAPHPLAALPAPLHRRENLHDEDAEGHSEWLATLKPGAPARHALLPLVWDGGPVGCG
jgi:hypothetical protein